VELHVTFRQLTALTVDCRVCDPHHRIVGITLAGARARRLDLAKQASEPALIVCRQRLISEDQNKMIEPCGLQLRCRCRIDLSPKIYAANFRANVTGQWNNFDHD